MDPCNKFQEETIGMSPVRVKPKQIHVTLYFSGYPALCETAGRPTPYPLPLAHKTSASPHSTNQFLLNYFSNSKKIKKLS